MRSLLLLGAAVLLAACGDGARARVATDDDTPSPTFRNVADTTVAYVGDSTCAGCHAQEARAYATSAMARSFHAWTDGARVESTLVRPVVHRRSGFRYAVEERDGRLWQVEWLEGDGGRRLHELARRVDYVVGSGRLARTYFTSENGRLFQLPLTWYADHGWDFSPGYEVANERFGRLLLDRCVACHASYPVAAPHLQGKYPELRPGIGCERCHGPGALHVRERAGGARAAGAYDSTIVNPARLPVARRMDVCEQCHVHTEVAVPREGKSAFAFVPSQRLSDSWAYFKTAGGIDVVSHADRLRQSACFRDTQGTPRAMECATCHAPHAGAPANADEARRRNNQPCLGCHQPAALAQQVPRGAREQHAATADCASCHMPRVRERSVPHGTFTEHWIRARADEPAPASADEATRAGVVPYFARDRQGADAVVYQGMGAVLQATLDNDARALAVAAARLESALGADSLPRADAWFMLGVAWQQLGRADEAIAALERSLGARPERPEALRALARAQALAGRDAGDIERLYERALAQQPALAWLRAEHADLLQARGDRARAIAQYRAALAEQPSLATGWFNLGSALVADGRRGEAEAAFRRAVQLEPALGEALGSLVEVRTARGAVSGVRLLGAPLPALAVRDRGRGAPGLEVAPGEAALLVTRLPPYAVVQVIAADGTTVRTLPTGATPVARWDLRTDAGAPVGAGLHRLRVSSRDGAGRPRPPQLLSLGIVLVADAPVAAAVPAAAR